MAKRRKNKPPDTSSVDTSLFNKGMVKDMNSSFQGKATWSHARNAQNNSVDGDIGVLGNEPSNFKCIVVPYTIIGAIHLYGDKWTIFSTDDIDSEIGLFDDSTCVYEEIVNDPCLNFNRMNLIKGASKENFDCTWQVYWDDDARNPSRTLNIDNIPWIQDKITGPDVDGNPCVTYVDTTDLDCEKIRLAPLVDTPCVGLTKAEDGGQLRNGSYQAYVAYTVNEQKIGDYIGISNVQSLFSHQDTTGALVIEVSNLDKEFEFYELVILSNTQNQIQAKKLGLYSTEQSRIHIDYIDQSLPVVPVEFLPLRNPAYEKSDSMYVVNDWLIRSGPTEQFDFNYQPFANQIRTKWVSVKYPADYYYNSGNKPTFLRDEVYAFFIRWIYNTGERSSSYHIPGRPEDPTANPAETGTASDPLDGTDRVFELEDTATAFPLSGQPSLEDGGVPISDGTMGYWESTERYPATQPEIWDANTGDPDLDLCGKPIRHHKMPVETTVGSNGTTELYNVDSAGNETINILGVRFYNIKPPVYNDGTLIPNIVGYEILRGSREGNKSILAKGIFRNMRKYDIDEDADGKKDAQGYYPNYPYNDLHPDIYLSTKPTTGCNDYGTTLTEFSPLGGVSYDKFTFHSPELMFKKPYLNAYYAKTYGTLRGKSTGHFIKSEDHPKNKLLRNGSLVIAGIFGIGYALEKMRGKTDSQFVNTKALSIGLRMNPAFPGGLTAQLSPTGTLVFAPGIPMNIRAPAMVDGAPAAAATASIQEGLQLALADIFDLLVEDAQALKDIASGGVLYDVLMEAKLRTSNATSAALMAGHIGGSIDKVVHGSAWKEAPNTFKILSGVFAFVYFATEGAQKIIDLIYELISDQDFAWKYNSHGFYSDFSSGGSDYNSKIEQQAFINNTLTSFGKGGSLPNKVNNLQRPQTVGIDVEKDFDTKGSIYDNSRYVIGAEGDYDEPSKIRQRNIEVRYGALKFSFQNQYGQLDGIKQIPVRSCVHIIDKEAFPAGYGVDSIIESPIMFGGDCYVNRYTEKVIMPFFWDFLKGQPDGYPYDYMLRQNIPHPRYWMNTERYSTSKFMAAVTSFSIKDWQKAMPTDLYYMDRPVGDCGGVFGGGNQGTTLLNKGNIDIFQLKQAYMYTHCNGVQDFYVESEVNLAQRDWEEAEGKRHYDWTEYTEYNEMFHANTIKKGNFYKYDYSLSVSRFPSTLSSWGNLQPRDYDPLIAETCFSYYPKRLIYSLQAQKEAKKDFWRVFLPNNYKDFKSQVNVIKPVNKSGALIMFPYLSPQMFQGLDTLKTDLGTKLIIGDGGLFSQPFQNIVNSDVSNEYGSCESERSVINTPAGLFFLSQEQGKVFHYSGQGLENIANRGMKWWFNKYLPSQLLKQFPELEGGLLSDNPVVGVGCQSIYDPNDDIVYFCKRDYVCNLPELPHDPPSGPVPTDPGPGVLPPGVHLKAPPTITCDCIEYNEELGFVVNLTKCQDAGTVTTCPPGYTLSEEGECKRIDCVPAVFEEEPPEPPSSGWCCGSINGCVGVALSYLSSTGNCSDINGGGETFNDSLPYESQGECCDLCETCP